MSRRTDLLLFLAGVGLAALIALFQHAPGYMDADYYYAGAVNLAEGRGFQEWILWNYLDDPAGVPHPSHGYWQPLASLTAAAGMLLTGSTSFAAARWPFVLLAGLVPVLTAHLAFALHADRRLASLAGWLAVFSGFYAAFLPTSDSFGLVMLIGGAYFWLLSRPIAGWRWVALGALTGLMHLARADGLVWLAGAWLAAACLVWADEPDRSPAARLGRIAAAGGLILGGYLLLAGPWLLRNVAVFGTPFSPGGGRALWLLDYDELFIYPAAQLSFARWQQAGWQAALAARSWAAGLNLQTVLAVQGLIFLLPLMLLGLWQLRRQAAARSGMILWGLLLVVMTLVFPFQGARGGFLHSGAAIQPLLWAAAPLGLARCLQWGHSKRGWNLAQARPFFSLSLLVLALFLTAFVVYGRLRPKEEVMRPGWNMQFEAYQQVEAFLVAQAGAQPADVVMVNNAPGYYAANRRSAYSIPYGDRAALLALAGRYPARYVLIEIDQVQGDNLYTDPGDRAGLHYLGRVANVHIYALAP